MTSERRATIRNVNGKWRGYLGGVRVVQFEDEETAKKWLEAPYKPEPVAAVENPPETQKLLMSDVGPIDAAQLRINAIHEAGHAVIMTRIAYGCEVTTVDPQEVKRLTGHAMPGFTRPVQKQIEARVYMCTALAGITSEAMHATNGMVSAAEDDIGHANEILDKMGLQGEPRDRQFLASRLQTQQLVTQYKSDIMAVADALIVRLTLSGEEVRALCT